MYDFLGIRLSLFTLIGNKTVLLLTTYPAVVLPPSSLPYLLGIHSRTHGYY